MLELLRDLTEIQSQSGGEDELRGFLKDFISDLGHKTKIDSAGNLIVKGKSDLWFITHLDTVEKLSEFRFDGEFAYGTGVADAKASIASILFAIEKLEELNLNFAFTVDEEEGGKGSECLSKSYVGRAVVMEPTEKRIAVKQLGSADIVLKVFGESAHGSYWNSRKNAIERAFEVILELKKSYKFSVQQIKGGGDIYAIPDYCEARLSFVFDFDDSINFLESDIKNKNVKFEILDMYEPISLDSIDELERYVSEKTVMQSWTDAYNFKKSGWKVTVWGPGELEICHTKKERIRIRDIIECGEIIVRINREVSE